MFSARGRECLEMNSISSDPENCLAIDCSNSDSDEECDNNNDKGNCNELSANTTTATTNTTINNSNSSGGGSSSSSDGNQSVNNKSQPSEQRYKTVPTTNARNAMNNQHSPNKQSVTTRTNDLSNNHQRTNRQSAAATAAKENRNQRMNHHHVNVSTPAPAPMPITGAVSAPDDIGYMSSSTSQPSVASSSSQLSPMSAFNEDRMRRKLQFFFMNPIEKWQARRKFPYKFAVQLVKIVVLTIQLCLFAHSRYVHVNYTWDNRVSFSHLFLRGWDDASEVDSYPAAKGPMALYFQDDFYDTIDYAMAGYANLTTAIGSYSYPTDDNSMPPLNLCITRYEQGEINGFNESYSFNPALNEMCLNLTSNGPNFSSKTYLNQSGVTINFAAFVEATLTFSIKTVNFKAAGPIAPPDCYQFDIEILFDNSDHDGQMLLSLDAEPIRLHCHGDVTYITDTVIDSALRSILNVFVITICVASLSLCTRALYRARLLQRQTDTFFRVTYGYPLSQDDNMQFVNFWYIMIVLNDILLILGSILKEQIERKNFSVDQWNICSVLLGVGNMLVWFGVLRYFSFFKTYNVVILTLKQSAPKILRFLLCALMIYAGYTFCGWLVLAPYHFKFRSLATTSECLFSLINGDDMFATFSVMSPKSQMLWWFSRIYLYSFIGLFIYVVISLFIAVIMDAYDTIKKYYKEGFPTSELKRFIGQMHPNDFSSGVFRANIDDEEQESLWETTKKICCYLCCGLKKKENPGPTGYETLVQSS